MREYKPIEIKKFAKKSFKNNEAKKFKKFRETKTETHPLTSNDVKICKNNSNLITYFVFDTIYHYDLANDLMHTKYPFSNDQITCGNLRSDGKIIYSGLANGKVNVYEANKKIHLRGYKAHQLQVNSLDISASLTQFVTASNDLVLFYLILVDKSF
jgi:WD40 repeat protein